MVFSDQAFIFFFFPVALFSSLALVRTRFFNLSILLYSLTFFYWESGALTLILLFSIVLNYTGGLVISADGGGDRKKLKLFVLVGANLVVLAYFKYTTFVLGTFDFFHSRRIEDFASEILLPIGISFYTFQGISYLIDVWRGDVRPERSIVTFAAYKTFFPQLIAGPIVRYVDVRDDFHHPKPSLDLFAAGAARFLLGLCKKVLIADQVAVVVDATFLSQAEASFASAWIGAIAFSIQIYFDFSGYSDMAIGIAAMMGIRFKENFNHPYAAATITEFWRRWHISLSSWFRDYLYIPLGGNRQGARRTYLNLLIVFLATGIWHGAAWNFVLWGLYHGTFLIIERAFRFGSSTSGVLRAFYFFPVVVVGWALFQAPDLGVFSSFAQGMLSPLASGAFVIGPDLIVAFSPQVILAYVVGAAAILMQAHLPPLGPALADSSLPSRKAMRSVFVASTMVLATIYVFPKDFSPFLYFRF